MTPDERLLLLADELTRLQPGFLFDMADWADGEKPVPESISDAISCGTACCAVGLACLLPEFNDEGFRFSGAVPCFGILGVDMLRGWPAVEEFFGLTAKDSYFLFDRRSYEFVERFIPAAVADRIREFVRERNS